MTTIARSRPGHWANADLNARFMDLADGDRRVSLAEQQDYMPASGDPMPVWLAISFFLVALPLLTTLVVWLVRLSLQH